MKKVLFSLLLSTSLFAVQEGTFFQYKEAEKSIESHEKKHVTNAFSTLRAN